MESSILLLPDTLKGKLKRPARIAIAYATDEAFNRAVAFYSLLLEEAATPEPGGISLPLGVARKDMELVLLKPKSTGQSANTVVVYWEVKAPQGHERDTLRAVHDVIASLPGYHTVIAPPNKTAAHAHQSEELAFSLIQDDSGNQFGLIVNPNYPQFIGDDSPQFAKLLLLLGGLGAGLLGPFLFRKLFR